MRVAEVRVGEDEGAGVEEGGRVKEERGNG